LGLLIVMKPAAENAIVSPLKIKGVLWMLLLFYVVF
jgi:hypothetical protein